MEEEPYSFCILCLDPTPRNPIGIVLPEALRMSRMFCQAGCRLPAFPAQSLSQRKGKKKTSVQGGKERSSEKCIENSKKTELGERNSFKIEQSQDIITHTSHIVNYSAFRLQHPFTKGIYGHFRTPESYKHFSQEHGHLPLQICFFTGPAGPCGKTLQVSPGL